MALSYSFFERLIASYRGLKVLLLTCRFYSRYYKLCFFVQNFNSTSCYVYFTCPYASLVVNCTLTPLSCDTSSYTGFGGALCRVSSVLVFRDDFLDQHHIISSPIKIPTNRATTIMMDKETVTAKFTKLGSASTSRKIKSMQVLFWWGSAWVGGFISLPWAVTGVHIYLEVHLFGILLKGGCNLLWTTNALVRAGGPLWHHKYFRTFFFGNLASAQREPSV
jgi:hypothetical protein